MSSRGWFVLALAWTGAIYSTLYVARPAAEFLRDRNLLRLTVWTIVALFAIVVLAWVRRRRPGPRGWAVLLLGTAAFLVGITSVSPVEVKLHFVQYGLLGALFYLALQARNARWAPFWAVLLTGAAGWIDEGIQYLLPNRWYDLQDVGINFVAGVISVVTMALYDADRTGWAERSPDGPEAG